MYQNRISKIPCRIFFSKTKKKNTFKELSVELSVAPKVVKYRHFRFVKINTHLWVISHEWVKLFLFIHCPVIKPLIVVVLTPCKYQVLGRNVLYNSVHLFFKHFNSLLLHNVLADLSRWLFKRQTLWFWILSYPSSCSNRFSSFQTVKFKI